MTDPSPTVLVSLYHSGAFLCLGIVAAYLALKYASTHWAWLEVPGRAHYVTVALAAAATVIVPISQGTSPNAQMIFVALGTVTALLLPGAPKSDTKTPQAGFARLGLLVMIAAICASLFGCGASANFDTRVQTVVTGVTYAQLAANQFDTQHEKDIALTCGNGITDPVAAKADCTTKVAAYRAELKKFNEAFDAAVAAIKAVVKLKNDQTVAGAEAAALIVAQALAALGVK